MPNLNLILKNEHKPTLEHIWPTLWLLLLFGVIHLFEAWPHSISQADLNVLCLRSPNWSWLMTSWAYKPAPICLALTALFKVVIS